MKNEILDRWQNDANYRKQVVRELEQKYSLRLDKNEFGALVY